MGVTPSGKHVSGSVDAIFRTADGKIVERWASQDLLGLLQEIGATI